MVSVERSTGLAAACVGASIATYLGARHILRFSRIAAVKLAATPVLIGMVYGVLAVSRGVKIPIRSASQTTSTTTPSRKLSLQDRVRNRVREVNRELRILALPKLAREIERFELLSGNRQVRLTTRTAGLASVAELNDFTQDYELRWLMEQPPREVSAQIWADMQSDQRAVEWVRRQSGRVVGCYSKAGSGS